MTPEDARKHWEGLAGAFVMNFGHVEAVACQWIYKLTNDQNARDKAIDTVLANRIKKVCELIPTSNLSAEQKQRALELWAYVLKTTKMRNVLAHSPFITNQKNESGFVDIKEMKGVLDGNPKLVEVLTFERVAITGRRTAKVLKELLECYWRDR
ncbi:MAG TPA: hypothetical protein VK815_04895 [Candidatus Acidoferrales bacterium]|nr:hypothetical protein [Candidatus Acidoferrales bacterium]